MTLFSIFLIVGIVLLVGELVTGTFYLLVIGLSIAIASVFSIFSLNPLAPILISGALSVIGCGLVYKCRRKSGKNDMVVKHVGQIAEVVEVSKNEIQVLYSGSYWNATLRSRDTIGVGDTVKIVEFSNNMLIVDKT